MSHGNSPALKLIFGQFEPMENNPHQMFCRKPLPHGPYVFVTKYLNQNARDFVPAVGEHYVVTIVGLTRTGKAERGDIRFSMSQLRAELLKALKQATWYRGSHRDRRTVGSTLETPFGNFTPIYNSGQRWNGLDESPSVWFTPDPDGPYAEILGLAHDHLFCTDEAEVARATNAPKEVRVSQDN